MTNSQKAISVVALGAAIALGVYEARRASRLLIQVERLQQQQVPLADQIQRLQMERDKATNMIRWLNEELAKSGKNDLELLQLRGAIGVLGQQLAESNPGKKQSAAPIPQAGQPADLIEQQKQSARIKGLDGRNYSMHLLSFAKNNQGWLPTNWEQVASFMKIYPVTGTNEFELVYKRPVNVAEFGTNSEKSILVREFLAWPTVDGQWGRIYGFADGHSLVVRIPDGNFTAWEEQNTFNPESKSR